MAHRKAVVEGNKDNTSTDSASYKKLSPTKSSPGGSPSRARRHAPPPPSQAGAKTGSISPRRGGSANASNKRDNRLSLQVDSLDRAHHDGGITFGSLPRHSAPCPPQRRESLRDQESDPRFPQRSQTVSGARPSQDSSFTSTFHPQQQQSSSLKVRSADVRRHSADTGVPLHAQTQQQTDSSASPNSPRSARKPPSKSSPQSPRKQDGSKRSPGSPTKQKAGASGSSGSPRRQMRRTQSASTASGGHASISEEVPEPAAPVPKSPEKTEPPRMELPTNFVASDGAELVEVVRVR